MKISLAKTGNARGAVGLGRIEMGFWSILNSRYLWHFCQKGKEAAREMMGLIFREWNLECKGIQWEIPGRRMWTVSNALDGSGRKKTKKPPLGRQEVKKREKNEVVWVVPCWRTRLYKLSFARVVLTRTLWRTGISPLYTCSWPEESSADPSESQGWREAGSSSNPRLALLLSLTIVSTRSWGLSRLTWRCWRWMNK